MPCRIEPLGQLGQDLRIIEVGEVGDQHRDQVRALGDEARSKRIGFVAKLGGRLEDDLALFRRQAVSRPEAARNRGLRNPGQPRDIVGCGAPAGGIVGGSGFFIAADPSLPEDWGKGRGSRALSRRSSHRRPPGWCR